MNTRNASDNWQDKHIAILGFGVEGKSSTNYFIRHRANITVHDSKSFEDLGDEAKKFRENGVQFKCESEAFQDLQEYDLVMRTPTFPPFHHALQALPADKVSSQANL